MRKPLNSNALTAKGRTACGAKAAAILELRLLGEIELWRGGRQLDLPPSKKTRALLAYLAVCQKPQRRERLCSMFWDIADDPRAALRWSLSKLRPLVDEPGVPRLITDGGSIAFETSGVQVDLFSLRTQLQDVAAHSTAELEQLAAAFRGEFLEGLELPDFHEFQFWCVALREESRRLQVHLLSALIDRLAAEPKAALAHARTWTQIDPLDEAAHATLLRLLFACDRRREAEQQYRAAHQLLDQLGSGAGKMLTQIWEELTGGLTLTSKVPPVSSPPASPPVLKPAAEPESAMAGRKNEWCRLLANLDEVDERRRLRIAMLRGEPGIGKTHLLRALMSEVRRRNGTVLDGAAYEAETSRPYGPWIDALRSLPAAAIGDTLGGELAPLLPELGAEGEAQRSRDRLFGAVAELIAARASSAAPVLVAVDDVQWCDGASAELLHYVARMNRNRPLLIALAARDGELPDNQPMLRVLRGLRRDGMLEELDVAPLTGEETAELVRRTVPEAEVERIASESAGNPLFALELARALPVRDENVSPTLRRLVRDRIDRLPAEAADALRWSAVVGQTFRVGRLAELTPLDIDHLLSAFETLERHGLLHAVTTAGTAVGNYAFAHDIVRQVVYAELSEPRRRLMHLRIAEALQGLDADDAAAADLAHHAALAGEFDTASRACIRAGRRCLRLFAATEADAMARRGVYYAEQLEDPERTKLQLELMEVRYAAHRPQQPAEAARSVEELAQRALDHGCVEHARLGFHIASYLRWEGGDWSDAQRQMMRAEQIGRLGDERERAVALAEAARCLTLLERDLGHAEALLSEARALSHRLSIEPTAIPDAIGMLRLHQGQLDEAAERFAAARELCRREQDRLGEFRALEHAIMVELQRHQFAEAQVLSDELLRLAGRLREGSEAPFAHALAALCRYATRSGGEPLEAAFAALRAADAKQRLMQLLTRAAELAVDRDDAALGRRCAEEALHLADVLERPSDIVLARTALIRAAARSGDRAACASELKQLNQQSLRGVSAEALAAAEHVRRLCAAGDASAGRPARVQTRRS